MKQQRIVDNSQSILNRSLIFMSGNYTAVPSEVDGLDLLNQVFSLPTVILLLSLVCFV